MYYHCVGVVTLLSCIFMCAVQLGSFSVSAVEVGCHLQLPVLRVSFDSISRTVCNEVVVLLSSSRNV